MKNYNKQFQKEVQIFVFDFLINKMEANGDSLYEFSVMREYPEIKLGHYYSKSEIIDAINHLVKIGYLKLLDCSKGYDIAITKKAFERWKKFSNK
jgi:hypothetical protein